MPPIDAVSCGVPRDLDVGARRLRTYAWGSGDTAVVLLHSIAAHSHWWDWGAPALAEPTATRPARGVVALDFRGHGDSAWAEPAAYDFDDHVADVVAVLDRLDVRAPLVIGHSMGGYVGALLAARHPQRVAALVMVDVLTGWSDQLGRRARQQAERPAATFASRDEAGARFRLVPADTTASPERLRHLGEAGVVEREPGTWAHRFDRRVFRHPPPDPWPFLGDVRCPALVMRGEGSPFMSREAGERAAKTMPSGTMAELRGAYHHVILDDPTGFARLVLDWEARRLPPVRRLQ